MIKLDKSILDKFDKITDTSNSRNEWNPTAEQIAIIKKYWPIKNKIDFVAQFRSIYPNSPKARETYRKIYNRK